GLPGETSASFFDTTEIGYLLNSNYPIFNRKSQATSFTTFVSQEKGRGHVITHVTYALGGNDMLDMLTPDFLALPFDQQEMLADQKLADVDANVVQALTLIRSQLPNTVIVVPGYYNPYGAFPGSAEDKIADYALPRLNQVLSMRANQFGGEFAEIYSGFVGREL